jgi:hypothetical protein
MIGERDSGDGLDGDSRWYRVESLPGNTTASTAGGETETRALVRQQFERSAPYVF